MAPIVSEMADSFDGHVTVFKVNADENPLSVSRFRVPLVPYLILFHFGEPIARFAESWSIDEVKSALEPREY